MQESRNQEATLRWLKVAEGMVHGFAENAKFYWRMWGPLGEPMVHSVDAWAEMQRGYLRWLREASGAGGESVAESSAKEAERSFVETVREAERSARESAEEAQRIAREAERDATAETERSPREDVEELIRESVSRSEAAGSREGPQTATAVHGEVRADDEGLPIENYNALSVNQVTQRIGELSVEEIERLRDYEAEHKNRRSLMQRFNTRIRATREGLSSSAGETE
jgi:hypothetical protein